MTHAQLLSYGPPSATGTEVRSSGEHDIQPIFDALEDADCRDMLVALEGEAMSASELSTACDMPLSTTYRKLKTLDAAGLIAERIRILRSGRHTSEYSRSFDDVRISLSSSAGVAIELTTR